jgi:hypothetical protein
VSGLPSPARAAGCAAGGGGGGAALAMASSAGVGRCRRPLNVLLPCAAPTPALRLPLQGTVLSGQGHQRGAEVHPQQRERALPGLCACHPAGLGRTGQGCLGACH